MLDVISQMLAWNDRCEMVDEELNYSDDAFW